MTEKLKQATREFTRREHIKEVARIMSIHAQGAVLAACMRTYGYRQDVVDGRKIKGQLEQMGFSLTESEDEADLILFSTCMIRKHAEDRMFGDAGALKNARRRNPSLIVVVCDCMMGQKHMAKCMEESFPFVGLVLGIHIVHKLPGLTFHMLTGGWRVFERGGDSKDKTIVKGPPIRRDGSFKTWVTVMCGCNSFCSYCIVPYVRGRERSHRPEIIFEEARSLVNAGYRDITLLGQNVNSYGRGLTPTISSAELLRQLDATDEGFQLCFVTSHPRDATHELIDTIVQSRHIPHRLHLPSQSDSNRILKAMSRSYTWERYLGLVTYTKEKVPDLSLTSGTTIGFPGETYGEFCETVSLVKEMEFISLFTFIYSPYISTRIAGLPDPVSYEEKSHWFHELLAVQEEIATERCTKIVGTVQRVLIEKRSSKTGRLAGHSGGDIVVKFDGGDEKVGEFCQVRVTTVRDWISNGELA